jgi:hypothetical protein
MEIHVLAHALQENINVLKITHAKIAQIIVQIVYLLMAHLLVKAVSQIIF